MPPVYQASCFNCKYQSTVFPAGYGAVLVDEPLAGAPKSFLAGMVGFGDKQPEMSVSTTPNLVVLAHPIESAILESTGHTWKSLMLEGRHVTVQLLVCADCGALYERKKLTAPFAIGCLPTIAVGVVSGFTLWLYLSSIIIGIFVGYMTIFMVALTVHALSNLYTRLRFRERIRILEANKTCPSCYSPSFYIIPTKKVVPCPACKAKSLQIQMIGIS